MKISPSFPSFTPAGIAAVSAGASAARRLEAPSGVAAQESISPVQETPHTPGATDGDALDDTSFVDDDAMSFVSESE